VLVIHSKNYYTGARALAAAFTLPFRRSHTEMSTKSKLALVSATLVTLFTSSAFAQTVNSPATNKEDVYRWAAAGAGFAIAIAALGGTLAQGRATAAALEGISRNPGASAKIQTPMILGLALIESLVLFAFVVAFLLQGLIKL
jgi:F-type H+-transporting ATPase subunit c